MTAIDKPYLRVRDLDAVLSTDHQINFTDITAGKDPRFLLSGNNSCILTPEVIEGPYWIKGELLRNRITKDQKGIALTLDIQIIDVDNCKPVPKAFLEIWHCNSTGVYSCVVANGNGNADDTGNLNTNFHRGIQQTDDNGVVLFETYFPGYYGGRAVSSPQILFTLQS